MGWIRTTTTTASVATSENTAPDIKPEVESDVGAEHVETALSISDQTRNTYPVLPKRTPERDLPLIPSEEVRKHDGKDGRRLFIVIDSIVLDCTSYALRHPAGKSIIEGFAGQDCSWQWWTFHDRRIFNDVAMSLRVGRTQGVENRHQKPKAFVGLRGFGYQDGDW